ncbi:glycosyltransferase family 2 protein [Maribacter sp. LLG6340-A2]|uniref:glycosyltransferase family 2 protein n=1 Tax=Maribacter sp. LLG6340-A2 TaxID=3160834 RepID=UPI0038643E09
MNSKKPVYITIIIPCFNEEDHIRHTLEKIFSNILDYTDYFFNILVLDDSSTDNSLFILNQLAPNFPLTIQILQNPSNMGIVESTKILLEAALHTNADYIIKSDMDADVPHDKILRLFLSELQMNTVDKIQVIIGERYITDKSTMSTLEVSQQQKMTTYLSKHFRDLNYNPVSSGVLFFSKSAIKTLLALKIVTSYNLRWGLDFLLPLLAHKLRMNIKKIDISQGNYFPERRTDSKIKAQYAAYYQVLELIENWKE